MDESKDAMWMLNLPADFAAAAMVDPNAQLDQETFQIEAALDADVFERVPADQIMAATKAYEQVAFIASYFMKASQGVPTPSIMPGDGRTSDAQFHLQTE